jgi:hypothetical protein
MARAAMTVTQLDGETAETPAFAAFNNTDGMYIAAGRAKGVLVLEFKNTNAAQRDVTILAGDGGDSGPAWRAGLGNLVLDVALTSGHERVCITDFARFVQSDGTIHIDAEGADVTYHATLYPL